MKKKEAKVLIKKKKMTYDQLLAEEIGVVAGVVGFSSSQTTSIYADSTVVKNPEVVYRGILYSQNRLLSEQYLLNFRRSKADMAMITGVNNFRLLNVVQAQACRKRKEDPSKLIKLPLYLNINMPVGPLIRSRRSFRNYSGKPISMEQLSTILYHAAGITGKMPLRDMPKTTTFEDDTDILVRAAPSGGGLYPISLYLFVKNVKWLAMGIYKYIPEHHALKQIRLLEEDFDFNQLGQFGEMEINTCNVCFSYCYELYANSRKYGDSGMAYAFIEAGEISSLVHLGCTALELGACDIGGYNKSDIEQLANLDGLTKHIIHFTIIGNK